jgi:type VI protein secretion system component VasK
MKQKWRSDILLLALALVFVCAVALWFFWPELSWRLGWDEKKAPPARASGESKEKLYEEDRRKLDELLKQRQSK